MKEFINNIVCGDSLYLLKDTPSESIDMVFADPPFNLGKNYNSHKDDLELKEYLQWCEIWISEMVRITKDTGSIFLHNIPKWLTYYSSFLNVRVDFKHWISWDASTMPMGKSLQPAHYGILYYAKNKDKNKFFEIRYPHKRCRKCDYLTKDYGGKKNKLHPFGPLVSDVWTDIHRIKHNKYRDEHPCQLPIHLMERIVLMSTDKDDIVLDPFSGTGTTAIAAKRLGRRYVGFEIDEDYVVSSQRKLDQEEEQSKLGNSWVSFFRDEVATIRDQDWSDISNFYNIPSNKKDVDHTKIEIKNIHNI